VSAVETPPPPEAPTAERRCPRCGAGLTPQQEWCLSCGADVGTRVAAPRGWKLPLAAVGLLLALAVIALILALVELAGPAEQVTEAPPTPTAAPPVAQPSAEPTASPTPAPAAHIAKWPASVTAWTLVLNSSGTREDAQRLANEIAAKGVPVGILDSDDFESLGPDSFVVFSGRYKTRAEAEAALATIRQQAGGGSSRKIVPKTG
jgi:septal ring-binding cell division protein DamX